MSDSETPSNSLAVIDGVIAEVDKLIVSICDAESARNAIAQSEMLEEYLKFADKAGEYASAFCVREAQILIKIAMLPDYDKVGRRREMILWLHSKTSDELNLILDECSMGTRVSLIKARETKASNVERSQERQLQEFKRINTCILTELKEVGRTRISNGEFYERWTLNEKPDKHTLTAFCNHTRNEALRMGGVGFEDSDHTYAMPVVCSREETRLYVETRMRSMHRDILSLAKHCEASNYKVPESAMSIIRADLEKLGSVGC